LGRGSWDDEEGFCTSRLLAADCAVAALTALKVPMCEWASVFEGKPQMVGFHVNRNSGDRKYGLQSGESGLLRDGGQNGGSENAN
jgi:hypothetical protein